MQIGSSTVAPSRATKSQISAFFEPELVHAARKYCTDEHLTLQELIGLSINTAAVHLGKPAFLTVRRERFVNRKKSPAKIQENLDGVRHGKKRFAAYFENADVKKVKTFSKEAGMRVEGLVRLGLLKILKMASDAKPDTEALGWDWSKIETAKLPRINKERTRSQQAA